MRTMGVIIWLELVSLCEVIFESLSCVVEKLLQILKEENPLGIPKSSQDPLDSTVRYSYMMFANKIWLKVFSYTLLMHYCVAFHVPHFQRSSHFVS